MKFCKNLSALVAQLKEKLLGDGSDILTSTVNVEHNQHIDYVAALERCISIQRIPDGVPMLISTDKGAPHRDLAEMGFDGFEWELTTLIQMIEIYEGYHFE